nr:peptidylprolyl isomerase [Akkermansiaceae bacterium]
PGELAAALKAEGIPDEAALRDRLAARIQQEKYVESRIAPKTTVTEEEARAWFEEHRAQLAIPERADLQWVFAATATPDEPAPEALANAMAALTAGTAGFSAVARDLAATPNFRVSRAWTTRDRLPDGLAGPVFDLPPGQPTLLRTRAGWHLVLIATRQPARQRDFAESAAVTGNSVTLTLTFMRRIAWSMRLSSAA